MTVSSFSEHSTEQFISWIHPLAKKADVEFDFYTFSHADTNVLFQKDALKNYSSSVSQNFILRVLKRDKFGTAYTKQFEKSSIEECFQQAMYGLNLSDKKERGDISSTNSYPDLTSIIYHSELDRISLADKINKARSLNQSTLSVDPRVQPVYNAISDHTRVVKYGNSQNHQGVYKVGAVAAGSYSLAVDQQKRGQGSSERYARNYADINFEELGRESAVKSLKKLSFEIPKTGVYPVVFHAGQPAPALLQCLVEHMSGKAVYEKLSLLGDRLNKRVFSELFHLYDDPFVAWGHNSQPFDAEGFPSKKIALVKEGVLMNYLTSSFFAKTLQVPHTAKANWMGGDGVTDKIGLNVSPTNIVMEAGDCSLSALLKTFPKGIIIDDLKGMAGYNSTSGDFSIESEGFLWTDGENDLRPLCQFTVSGNIIDMFANILKVSNDLMIHSGNIKAPSFLVPELSIAGK